MKKHLFLLLLSLSAVEGRFPIEHTYLPQCICPPYSIDTTVEFFIRIRDPDQQFFELLDVDVTVNGEPLDVIDGTTVNTGRIPLRIDAGLPYASVTKIVNVPADVDARVWVEMLLVPAASIPVDGTSTFTINIPRFLDPEALVLEFPENSFPVADITVWRSVWTAAGGQVFQPGSSELESVSGDFCSVGEDGRKQALISEGVFSLQFTDATNQTFIPGAASKLRVRESVLLDNIAPPVLYGLNKDTGFWEYHSNFVPLGDGFLEANVQVSADVNDFNIAYTGWDICVMKVKVTNLLSSNSGVEVCLSQNFEGSSDWVYYNAGTTVDDLCLRVRCCKPGNPTCSSFPKLRGDIYAIQEGDIGYGAPTVENNGFSDELNAALDYSGGGSINSVIEAFTGPIYPSIQSCKEGNLHFLFSHG